MEKFKIAFLSLYDLQSLADLLNNMNEMVDLKSALIQKKDIFDLSNNKTYRYKTFSIPKKNGDSRTIKAPIPPLKHIQKKLSYLLNLFFYPQNAVNGFVLGRSIVSNAQYHVGKRFVYNIDLKDFFTSVKFIRVRQVFMSKPFQFNELVSSILANLCCEDGSLPQGSPVSPIITNFICLKLDTRLSELAKAYQLSYTRYADDLTFSSNNNIFKKDLIFKIKSIIADERFTVNNKKERLQTKSERQEVTGVIVNEKLNVSRKYIKEIRAMLHSWENKGYAKSTAIFNSKYTNEKFLTEDRSPPDFEKVLFGKIQFLGMIRGKDDFIYKRFYDKFKILIDTPETPKTFEDFLSTWQEKGITQALNQL